MFFLWWRKKKWIVAWIIGILSILLSSLVQFLILPILKTRFDENICAAWILVWQIYCLSLMAEFGISEGVTKILAHDLGDPNSYAYYWGKRILWWAGFGVSLLGIFMGVWFANHSHFEEKIKSHIIEAVLLLAFWSIFRFRMRFEIRKIFAMGDILTYQAQEFSFALLRFIGLMASSYWSGDIRIMSSSLILAEAISLFFFNRIISSYSWGQSTKVIMISPNAEQSLSVLRRILIIGFSSSLFSLGLIAPPYICGVYSSMAMSPRDISIFYAAFQLPFLFQRILFIPLSNYYPTMIGAILKGQPLKYDFVTLNKNVIIALLGLIIIAIILSLVNPAFLLKWLGKEFNLSFLGSFFCFGFAVSTIISFYHFNLARARKDDAIFEGMTISISPILCIIAPMFFIFKSIDSYLGLCFFSSIPSCVLLWRSNLREYVNVTKSS